MELELVPLDGEDNNRLLLSPEERERMILRIKPIQPEALQVFDTVQRQQIQTFLSRLIAVSEQLHQDMDDFAHKVQLREHMDALHAMRTALFEQATPAVNDFNRLVDLSAAEPWLEWEVMLKSLQREMEKEDFKSNTTTERADVTGNPFLRQADGLRKDTLLDVKEHGRYSAHDIEKLIVSFSLEELVKFLILSRKVITGQFWERDYDL